MEKTVNAWPCPPVCMMRGEVPAMSGKTYRKIVYHMVFVTKYRNPALTGTVMGQVRVHFRKKGAELGIRIHIVNGYRDHVHLLVTSPPRLSVAEIARHLKGYSSFMIRELQWQPGYGVFTVDEISFKGVFSYIRDQERRHGGR